MKKQTDILVIDDEPVVLDAVVKLCSAEGFQVDAAVHALEGLKKIAQSSYRLIVCDIMMPDMDGFQFLERLNEKHVATPVIITTGYSTVENAVKSLYLGAIDFLAKPFTVEELLSTVRRGMKYQELSQSFNAAARERNDLYPVYVPCPPSYYRLGYTGWVNVESDGSVKTGLSDLFIKTLGGIRRIEFFEREEEIVQGNVCARVETEDQLIHNVLAPISGKILNFNETLSHNCALVEKDPYFRGWLYTVLPSDLEYELKHLTPCSSDRL